jgi:protein-disulfide isomerase
MREKRKFIRFKKEELRIKNFGMKKIAVILLAVMLLAGCKKVDYTEKIQYHPKKGSDLARVKIVEWSDFQCPSCGAAYQQLGPVFKQYADGIQVELRHFPLTSIHPYALGAAVASECAADQGKFWEYHDLLFENQTDLKKKDLITYATRLGLDTTLFQNCYDSQVKNKQVRADIDEGKNLGIDSTPTFFIDGKKVDNWTTIPQMLATLLPSLAPTSTPSILLK